MTDLSRKEILNNYVNDLLELVGLKEPKYKTLLLNFLKGLISLKMLSQSIEEKKDIIGELFGK